MHQAWRAMIAPGTVATMGDTEARQQIVAYHAQERQRILGFRRWADQEYERLRDHIRGVRRTYIRTQTLAREEIFAAQDDQTVPPAEAAQNALDIANLWRPRMERLLQREAGLKAKRNDLALAYIGGNTQLPSLPDNDVRSRIDQFIG